MSWWARSISNALKLDDDEDDDIKIAPKSENPGTQNDDASSPRGVKEDLSELTKTLTTQFWGVASFLAPPPQPEPKSDPETSNPEPDSLLGIRGDFAEIGGKFRSGISRLSNNINVSEITKMATNFLQLESDGEDDEMSSKREGFDSSSKGAVGVTEEVVEFARDIAMQPGTWLDFPLPYSIGDDVDFDMSDAQQEHALAVERLVPRLAALRIELCPEYMNESCFWKIYFVLVHPRLDQQDAELLSTPQIVEARASLAYELKNQTTTKTDDLSEKKSLDIEEKVVSHHEEPLCVPSPVVTENKPDEKSDIKINNSTTEATPEIMKPSIDSNKSQMVDDNAKSVPLSVEKDDDDDDDDDDADDWLKEEPSEISGTVGKNIPIENEDDVSFSDLEEDDDGDVPTSYRKSNYSSSDKESREWVQLGKSSSDVKHSSDSENANKESNDWLDVDDIAVT